MRQLLEKVKWDDRDDTYSYGPQLKPRSNAGEKAGRQPLEKTSRPCLWATWKSW